MGRPPIGKTAMTGAERVRRYRLKHSADKPVAKPATKPIAATYEAEIASLKAENANLKERLHATLDAKTTAQAAALTLLSRTQQEKLEAFKRAYTKQQDREYKNRVQHEVTERVVRWHAEYWTPTHQKYLDDAEAIYNRRKGIWESAIYKLIWSCLHPDSRESTTEKKLNEAFNAFNEKRAVLCKEVEVPKPKLASDMPRNWAEMQAARDKVRAGNRERAKRAAATRAARKS